MELAKSWTSRGEGVRLDFYIHPVDKTSIQISAKLFMKNVDNDFADTGTVISEKEMRIETENINALMRGISQKVFNLSDLNKSQKKAILDSLDSRNISVENWINRANLTIHALP